MRKSTISKLIVIAIAGAMGSACAVSDYVGYRGNDTVYEAKMAGFEWGLSGAGSWTGTYAYTVQYDWDRQRIADGCITDINIRTYHNPVPGAFTQDHLMGFDGDQMEGSAGSRTGNNPATPEGVYNKVWRFDDGAGGCQFFTNRVTDHQSAPEYKPAPGPGVAFCFNAPRQEIDRKNYQLLQANYASMSDFAHDVWTLEVGSAMNLNMNSITINDTNYSIDGGVSIDAIAGIFRPAGPLVDVSSPGFQNLINIVLENTNHQEAVTVELHFDGGFSYAVPQNMSLAFDHDEINANIQS